jgi:glycine/D-amino acid oxidase-like deaminating enzyme
MLQRRAFAGAAAAAWFAPAFARAQDGGAPATSDATPAPPTTPAPPATPRRATLPSPNLALARGERPQFIAGLRPHRAGSYRLETETASGKLVIHNYGHGGGGITMSWGCAAGVLALLQAQRATLKDTKVAVLGAGVMGLTAAVLLAEAGYDVAVYAQHITPNTTSDKAGGQWAPTLVENDNATKFKALLKSAYSIHLTRGATYGVSERDNYTLQASPELVYAQMAGAAAPEQLARLPFSHVRHGGYRYPTLLVEPPVLMKRLMADLKARGVTPIVRTFASASEIATLPGSAVVNCLGLGAREVWADKKLNGIKGVLAFLPPQPSLTYLYSGIGYLFPRKDHLVVGGSIEDLTLPQENETPDPKMGYLIIKIVRAVFDGALPAPPWLSGLDRLSDKDWM